MPEKNQQKESQKAEDNAQDTVYVVGDDEEEAKGDDEEGAPTFRIRGSTGARHTSGTTLPMTRSCEWRVPNWSLPIA